jgi:hypothetical protein
MFSSPRLKSFLNFLDQVIIMNARPRFGLKSLTLVAVILFSSFVATRQVQAHSSVNVDISIFHDALARLR